MRNASGQQGKNKGSEKKKTETGTYTTFPP